MASKTLATIISLKDQFTGPARKIAGSTKNINREVQKTANQLKKMSDSAKTHMGNFAKYSSMAAVGFVAAFAKKSVDAAKETIEASTKLSAVLKNVKGVTDKQVESIKNYAGALEELGVVDGDVTIAGMQQLGTYQLQADTLKTLMPGMNDLLAQQKGLNATGQDAVSIGNLMGKVMTGQVGALKKVGISFDAAQEKVLKHGTESQKAAMLAKVLQMNVGGVNKALAETDQGKIQQATTALGNMQEDIGARLLPVLGTFAKWFQTKLPAIQQFIFNLMDSFKNLATKVSPYMSQIKGYISSVIDRVKVLIDISVSMASFIINNWSMIKPVIMTVVGAMAAYKAIMIAQVIYTKAFAAAEFVKNGVLATGATVVNAQTIAQWALNAAMKANPIGLIIGALTLLTTGLIVAYNKSETFRNIIQGIGEKIAILIEPLKTAAGWVSKLFGGGKDKNINVNSNTTTTTKVGGMQGYAKGGIANKPSIFGEAGPEIAIPLNNSQRSKDLLSQANGIINGKESPKNLNELNKNIAKNTASSPVNQNNNNSKTVITNQNVTNNSKTDSTKTPIQLIFQGDMYGFDDFKEKAAKAIYEVINITGSNMVVVD